MRKFCRDAKLVRVDLHGRREAERARLVAVVTLNAEIPIGKVATGA